MDGVSLKVTKPIMVGSLFGGYMKIHRPLDKAADILAALCMRVSASPHRPLPGMGPDSQELPTWRLKANVTVFRHADRTPKVVTKCIVQSVVNIAKCSKSSNSIFLLVNPGRGRSSRF